MNNKIKILLIVSLGLNIFLLGFAASEVKHFMRPQRGQTRMIKEFMERQQPLKKEIDAERQKAIRMIGKKDFNMEKYTTQVEKVGELQKQMFQAFSLDMAKELRAMPEDERNAILEKISSGRRPSEHRRR